MAYDLGDAVGIGATVRDAAGVPTDAGTVTLTVTLPDGTTTSPPVANPPATTGEYSVDYLPEQPGQYQWRLVTTGPNTALTGSFDVRPADPPLILSLADAKRHLNKSVADTTDDEELREVIEATTSLVESIRGEAVARRQVVEDIGVRACIRAVGLSKYPILSLTSVVRLDASVTWDVANLHVGDTGIVTVLSGPLFQGLLRFTYLAGYTVLPANFSLAAKIIVAHLWETQRPSLVHERYGTPRPFNNMAEAVTPTGTGYAIPNRALELLGGIGPLVA